MNVRAEPHVVGKIPAHIVGILVDHDLIAIPKPITAVADIDRGDTEIKSAKPETAGTASGKPPDVMRAKATTEVAMLPRMIEMQFGSWPMSDPRAVVVYVRRFRMTFRITK